MASPPLLGGGTVLALLADTLPVASVAEVAPADLVLVNLRAPAMTPLFSEESDLVYSATGSLVDTVICDGRILMLHGEVPGEEEILAQAAASAAALVKRAGL